nr:hypothetical protein [uncultured Sellimonas sp.]
MNRKEFIEKLRILLGDLSEEEREEAVQYYKDYFEDAGEEQEQQVLKELGSPEKVALMIREGLKNEDDGGEFTETGYTQKRYEYKEVPAKREEETNNENNKKDNFIRKIRWNDPVFKILWIILILCVIAPVILKIVLGIIFGAFGLVLSAFGFFIGLVVAAAAVAISGICTCIVGISLMFSVMPVGFLTCGIGLILFAIGIIIFTLTIKLCIVVFPIMVRGVVWFCEKLFHRRKEGAK